MITQQNLPEPETNLSIIIKEYQILNLVKVLATGDADMEALRPEFVYCVD